MSESNYRLSTPKNPPSIEDMTNTIRVKTEEIIQFCTEGTETNFYRVEQSLRSQVYQLACLLLELYLLCGQKRFDYAGWLKTGLYSKGDEISRTIKTIFGPVRYWRHYFMIKSGGGLYPLDAHVGLPQDGLSPLVISLATK